jgi:RNA polymerase sigma-70 factor (ECF subfamily)
MAVEGTESSGWTADPERIPVTQLLQKWGQGDREAFDRLLPIVHEDLRQLARRRMRSLPPGSTLQATALVNEVYLRLVDASSVNWQDRAHFFAIAAKLMRQVAADNARARNRTKRGGGLYPIALDDVDAASPLPDMNLIALDEALDRLAVLDARKARVVEMRFFGGLQNGEIAEVLQVSVDTVKRDWSFAKLWLAREVKGQAEE